MLSMYHRCIYQGICVNSKIQSRIAIASCDREEVIGSRFLSGVTKMFCSSTVIMLATSTTITLEIPGQYTLAKRVKFVIYNTSKNKNRNSCLKKHVPSILHPGLRSAWGAGPTLLGSAELFGGLQCGLKFPEGGSAPSQALCGSPIIVGGGKMDSFSP